MEKFLLALYVIVAIAMIGFILMQRGPGAQAGSGFGSGASGTVFGSRGSANFLSSSTKWLAIAFFVISIAMGAYISRVRQADGAVNLGVMAAEAEAAKAEAKPAAADPSVPAATAPATTAPEAAAPATDASVPAPAAATEQPAAAAPVDAGQEVENKDSESSQN